MMPKASFVKHWWSTSQRLDDDVESRVDEDGSALETILRRDSCFYARKQTGNSTDTQLLRGSPPSDVLLM